MLSIAGWGWHAELGLYTIRLLDYPYNPNEAGREFLDKITLAPVDFEKFTHENAEKLLKIA